MRCKANQRMVEATRGCRAMNETLEYEPEPPPPPGIRQALLERLARYERKKARLTDLEAENTELRHRLEEIRKLATFYRDQSPDWAVDYRWEEIIALCSPTATCRGASA